MIERCFECHFTFLYLYAPMFTYIMLIFIEFVIVSWTTKSNYNLTTISLSLQQLSTILPLYYSVTTILQSYHHGTILQSHHVQQFHYDPIIITPPSHHHTITSPAFSIISLSYDDLLTTIASSYNYLTVNAPFFHHVTSSPERVKVLAHEEFQETKKSDSS